MTDTAEFQRWQQRYSTPDYTFGREPNEFLVSCRPLLPRSGKALAVADGEGRNGVWLAKQGLDVLSIDFSPAAQAKFLDQFANGGALVDIERGADLEDHAPDGEA